MAPLYGVVEGRRARNLVSLSLTSLSNHPGYKTDHVRKSDDYCFWRNVIYYRNALLQGYLAHKKLPLPQDHRRSLGMGLL